MRFNQDFDYDLLQDTTDLILANVVDKLQLTDLCLSVLLTFTQRLASVQNIRSQQQSLFYYKLLLQFAQSFLEAPQKNCWLFFKTIGDQSANTNKNNKIYKQYLKATMTLYLKQVGGAAALLLLVFTLPHFLSSIFTTHSVTPANPRSFDSAFIPKLHSQQLVVKMNQLLNRISSLKKGASCSEPVNEVCSNLQAEYKKLLARAEIAYNEEINRCLAFETEWNTTCQTWKAESQKLKSVMSNQSSELKNNLVQIRTMGKLISQLQAKIRNTPTCQDKLCPPCDGADRECPSCPPSVDNCAVCQVCKECPECYDENYNQLQTEYTDLYRRFQECEGIVEDYQNKPQDRESCDDIRSTANQKLKIKIRSLGQLIQRAPLSSQNLRIAISKAEEKLVKSSSLEESLTIIPSLLNTLAQELQDLAIKSKQRQEAGCYQHGQNHHKMLNECMGSFKNAVDKLKLCEKQLSPFLAENKQ